MIAASGFPARAAAALLALMAVAIGGGACEVGQGSGAATGTLYVQDCTGSDDLGKPDQPAAFDLKPAFFAGEPIEDISQGHKDNRLVIRLQRSGKRVELDDIVTFDVVSMYVVARCVRGRVVAAADGSLKPDYDQKNCFWGPDGPRVRVGQDQSLRANLVPRGTCERNVVGTAVSGNASGGNWDSWIEFESFGAATQLDRAPQERDQIGVDFKLEFGERLHARAFALTLKDDRILAAIKSGDKPPAAEIKGSITGWFDFDLERGQGAQTFP